VLLNQDFHYLETESEKVRFFCGTLNLEKHHLPSRLYVRSKGSRTSVRYFVDKFPMFLVPPSPVVTFTYVHDGATALADFVHHLQTYLPLFRELSDFRFVYASRGDLHFPKVTEIFRSLVQLPLESDIGGDLLRYLRVRKAWDEKRYGAVTEADLVFRNEARGRFSGERFEGIYRGWKNGRISESTIWQEFAANDRKRAVHFRTFLLTSMPADVADSANAG